MIHSIVNPPDDIAPQFQGWEVRKTNGDTVTGLQGHIRNGKGVSLLGFDGREMFVPEKEVVSFGAMSGSLMPEGLPALFSVEEFRDLVAWLSEQR